ncbi:MAG: hypothetical protein ACRDD1_14720, partial [Planctomycetia bacterium]
GKAGLRPVTVGEPFGAWVVIDDGLEEGESVVTNGQFRIVPGTVVKVRGVEPGFETPNRPSRPPRAGLVRLPPATAVPAASQSSETPTVGKPSTKASATKTSATKAPVAELGS